ncbi:variant surface glycoprotein VSG [Trypanosoma brucei equiperdum]|uniref:Variant surface glycoprotein VSG n=1 Tax=Trypanosoma brucei equiperdum TaxID=630700 RepID=A0A3L6KUX8_9TRYP|nr:variant surface glycoprotein VSG [Trypanosoma brucei equiperdum]
MCGSDATHKYDDGSKKCKDIIGGAATKAAKCAQKENGKALATDILCICSDQTEDACAAGDAHQNHGGGSIPNNEISKITGGCPNHGVAIPLDVAITAAIGRVAGRIRNLETTKAVVGIGKVTGTDCASSDNANCVNYKDLLIGNDKGNNKIPWYNEPAQPTPCDVTKLSGGKILLSETNPEGLKKLKLTPDTIFKLQIIELQAEAKGNMATDPTQGQSYGACINAGSTRTPKTSGVTAQATAVQEATAQTDVDI